MFGKLSKTVDSYLGRFITGSFTTFLKKCLRNRYITIASSIFILLFSLGMFIGGHIKFNFMPEVEGEKHVCKTGDACWNSI